MFQQKADRLEGVLKAIVSERPSVEPVVGDILALVRQARELADQRNQYVHAVVLHDLGKSIPYLRRRGKEFQCDERQLEFLADGASRLAFELGNTCAKLHEMLDPLRSA